jgi:hypothetical protein
VAWDRETQNNAQECHENGKWVSGSQCLVCDYTSWGSESKFKAQKKLITRNHSELWYYDIINLNYNDWIEFIIKLWIMILLISQTLRPYQTTLFQHSGTAFHVDSHASLPVPCKVVHCTYSIVFTEPWIETVRILSQKIRNLPHFLFLWKRRKKGEGLGFKMCKIFH